MDDGIGGGGGGGGGGGRWCEGEWVVVQAWQVGAEGKVEGRGKRKSLQWAESESKTTTNFLHLLLFLLKNL